jgi:hypothetical protein
MAYGRLTGAFQPAHAAVAAGPLTTLPVGSVTVPKRLTEGVVAEAPSAVASGPVAGVAAAPVAQASSGCIVMPKRGCKCLDASGVLVASTSAMCDDLEARGPAIDLGADTPRRTSLEELVPEWRGNTVSKGTRATQIGGNGGVRGVVAYPGKVG